METGTTGKGDLLHPIGLVVGTLLMAIAVVQLKPVNPFIDANATGIVGAMFLLSTWAIIHFRREHPSDYGFRLSGWAEEAAAWLVVSAVVFPLFFLGFRIWWHVRAPFDWELPWPLWQIVLTHLAAVAIPEELLFRGFVQQRLGAVFKRRVNFLGIAVGWALPLTAAIFALGHFLTDLRPDRLATFFPALAFGLLKERRGSLVAPVLFHASCNVFSDILAQGYFG